MSIVNKMLRDLEARNASSNAVSADYQAPNRRPFWWWLIGLCIVISFVVGYWYLNLSSASLRKPRLLVEESEQYSVESQQSQSKAMLVATSKAGLEQSQPVVQQVEQSATDKQHIEKPQNPISNLNDETQQAIPLEQIPDVQASSMNAIVVQTIEDEVKPLSASFNKKSTSQADLLANLRESIKDALANNNEPLAISLLTTLHEQEPDNIALVKKLASLLFANNNIPRATTLLQRSIQGSPLRGDLRLMLARLYVQQKNPQVALTLLNEIEPEQHVEIDYWAYRANLAQQLSDFARAKQDYSALTRIESNKASWWLGLGITQEKLGAPTLAKEAYQNALKLAQLDQPVSDFIEQRIHVLAGHP
jgi:MSHA biogenesis protein MshN